MPDLGDHGRRLGDSSRRKAKKRGKTTHWPISLAPAVTAEYRATRLANIALAGSALSSVTLLFQAGP